jgi:RNA polymerase sigma factor (sigma-70 family)
MGDRLDSFPAHALDAETRRLLRLARGLLYGEHDAQDAVQEAWLTVLGEQGQAPRSLAGWLTGTVRRMSVTTRRAAVRRRRRESAAARGEALPSAADSAGRIEVLRLLLEAVQSLAEPYRRTIVMRFFEDLAPREIARREGTPVNTVRSHLARGLGMLRERLDAGEEGRRRDFLAALAPLAGRPPWTAGALGPSLIRLGGVQLMKRQVNLALLSLAALLVAGVGWRVLSSARPRVADPVMPRASLEGAGLEASRLTGESSSDGDRTVAEFPATTVLDWVVRGQATLGNLEPLVDAPLVVRLFAGGSTDGGLLLEQRVRTDSQGAFEWGLPRPERLVTIAVAVDLAGHVSRPSDTPVAHGDGPPQDLLVTAQALDVVAVGRVLRPDGEPFAGARVLADWDETRTNAEGRYRLRGSSRRGTLEGTIVAEGYRPAKIVAVADGPGEVRVEDSVLLAGGSLRGRVIDAAGLPVAGVEIQVWSTVLRTSSDGAGRFELTSLDPEKSNVWLRATGAGFCGQGRLLTAEELEAGELEWVLERGALVRGHVFEEDGTPVKGAHLYLAMMPESRPGLECWSGAGGAFEFPAAQAGENTVWALRDGFQATSQSVVVPPSGQVLGGLDLRLRKGSWLAGQVVDGANQPVPWVWVYFRGNPRDRYVKAVHANVDGRFRLADLSPGRAILGFLMDGFQRHEQVFHQLDEGGQLVRLERSGGLAGRVIDGLTGEPLSSFRIHLVAPVMEDDDKRAFGYRGNWSVRGPGMPFVGTDGYWSTTTGDRFIPGEVVGIQAEAAGYVPSVHGRAVVALEPDRDALVIPMYCSNATVRGRVRGAPDGGPVAGATVRSFRFHPGRDEGVGKSATTDEFGAFELEGLPVGPASLVIEHPDWIGSTDGPFDVPPTGSVARSIELTRGSTLHVVLLDGEGAPRPDEVVGVLAFKIENPRRGEWEGTTDDLGRVAFQGLQRGSYQLVWKRALDRDQMGYYLNELVTLDGAGPSTVELRPKGKALLRGEIDFAGALPEFVHVSLRPSPPNNDPPGADLSRSHSTVAMDGRFEFDHLQPGTYMLSAFARGLEGHAEVKIPEQGEVDVRVEVRLRER